MQRHGAHACAINVLIIAASALQNPHHPLQPGRQSTNRTLAVSSKGVLSHLQSADEDATALSSTGYHFTELAGIGLLQERSFRGKFAGLRKKIDKRRGAPRGGRSRSHHHHHHGHHHHHYVRTPQSQQGLTDDLQDALEDGEELKEVEWDAAKQKREPEMTDKDGHPMVLATTVLAVACKRCFHAGLLIKKIRDKCLAPWFSGPRITLTTDRRRRGCIHPGPSQDVNTWKGDYSKRRHSSKRKMYCRCVDEYVTSGCSAWEGCKKKLCKCPKLCPAFREELGCGRAFEFGVEFGVEAKDNLTDEKTAMSIIDKYRAGYEGQEARSLDESLSTKRCR